MNGQMKERAHFPLRAAVVGWPIKHSRSPLIHNYWLERHGISERYDKIAIEPDRFPDFVRGLGQSGLRGCNVTIPHKQVAFAMADVRHPEAEAVKAANTLWLDNGRLHATNTDTYGFMTHLAISSPNWQSGSGPVVLLGAGGATRAIIYGLVAAGVDRIHLTNRTRASAEALASGFGPVVRVFDWSDRSKALQGATCLINTTSLGMVGYPPLDLDISRLSAGATVADIVYVPLETPLLADARRHGLVAVDGLGMLLHQAAPAFENWYGFRPEVTAELRALVVADLEG